MLSVRNVILTALLIFVLALGLGIYSLMGPPDSNGAGVDSYGTHRDGFRASYELLSAFDISVERSVEPPSPNVSTSTTLVLWMPHDDLIANEPAYLERLLPWIERGGRLVIAVPPPNRASLLNVLREAPSESHRDIWSILKLDGLRVVRVSLDNDDPAPAMKRNPFNSPESRHDEIRRSVEKVFGMHSVQYKTMPVVTAGQFQRLGDRVRQLQIPVEDSGGLDLPVPHPGTLATTEAAVLGPGRRDQSRPPTPHPNLLPGVPGRGDQSGSPTSATAAGTIECIRKDGTKWTVAATFSRGEGEIVVVAEPMLLMNASIGIADNSVLAFDLLASAGKRVIFDEFYHGLSVRGNPLWLLTKSTYSTVVISILSVLALELWRRAILLGPPLDALPKSRRTMIEYIEAMARFLNRSRRSRPFLLREIRDGTVRVVAARCGLSHAVQDPRIIATALARRSPRDADRFREAMTMLDTALAKDDDLSETEAIRVMQRISHCL